MFRAYKYRLYPTQAQIQMFLKTFGCVRFIYNKMLADRIAYYRKTKKSLHNTPAQYKKEYPFLKEVDSLALSNAQLHLNTAYKNFFEQKSVGKPKFKSRKNFYQSYSTNNQKGSVRIENGKIRLPKIGFVKIRQHRSFEGLIKTVTVSKTPSEKYYISILVECDSQVIDIIPKTFLGLDFAMHDLYIASDGSSAEYPRYYRLAQKNLARAQRKLSRTKQGSNNHKKARKRVAIIHEKISNKRKDFLQKKSKQLADVYDAICIEDISVKQMGKHHRKGFHFGKSVADNGWGMFTSMLAYKLRWQGKQLIKIDKWFPSSQICNVCGYHNHDTKDLSIREWTCPSCGIHHNRDINAAINIREEGKRQISIVK